MIETAKCPMAFHVVAPWHRSYEPALAVGAGEVLRFVKRDSDWPGWVWCVNGSGLGGWLPESILSIEGARATAREAIDTTELTVAVGERLAGIRERAGWIWCRNEMGNQGWVPRSVLEALEVL